jgi:rare lipoprotein A
MCRVREPEVSGAGISNPLLLLAVVLTATTLAACAQPGAVNDKSASLAVHREPAPEPTRKASSVRNRQATNIAKEPADTPGASYGIASYYSGTRTASGEKFDAKELTAAHRTLPFGTLLLVTNVKTGRSVTVRVNDRGPFISGRVVDVSHAAAEKLGMVGSGLAKVKVDVVQ